MSQLWTEDCFASGHVGQTDLANMEKNFICLRTLFSGLAQPASMAACHPWFDTAKHVLKVRDDGDSTWYGLLHGDTNQKLWVYRNTAMAGWKVDAGVSDRVLALKKVGGTYATGGATAGTWTQPNHLHTGPSHTHTGPSHSHTGPSHSHTGPSHSHGVGTYKGPSHSHARGTYAGPSHTHGAGSIHARVAPNTIASDLWFESVTGVSSWSFNKEAHCVSVGSTSGNSTLGIQCGGTSGTGGTGAVTGTSAASGTAAVTGTSAAAGTGATGDSGTGATGSDGTGATGSSGTEDTGGSATVNTYRPAAAVGTLQYLDL